MAPVWLQLPRYSCTRLLQILCSLYHMNIWYLVYGNVEDIGSDVCFPEERLNNSTNFVGVLTWVLWGETHIYNYIKRNFSLMWDTYRIWRMHKDVSVVAGIFASKSILLYSSFTINKKLLPSSYCGSNLYLLETCSDSMILILLVCSRLLIMRGSETDVATTESVHGAATHHTIKGASDIFLKLYA